jgi:uncharacterized protein (TIGR04222 family)
LDLISNPLADLSGPEFLVVYAIFAIGVIVAARARTVPAAAGTIADPGPVTVDRDPYEVAYLRGGANELLRFTVFDLVSRGFLMVPEPAKPKDPPTQVVQTGQGDPLSLNGFQREVVAFYGVPHTTAELFASNLPAAAETFAAASFKPRLEAERFFAPPGAIASATLVRGWALLALLSLSGYRFFTAIVKHHNNVLFLTIETVLAVVALLLLTRVSRLSLRGRSYLQRLTTALKSTAAPLAAGAGMLPILVAATGLEALADTQYASMNRLFPRRSSRASGSCSGGCGGGGGDSSGGGDGGGGCGGGCGG